MIVEAITLLLAQLNAYIALDDGGGPGAPNQALLGNIAQLDRPETATELDNHLVLSLVKLEEERTLKNGKSGSSAMARARSSTATGRCTSTSACCSRLTTGTTGPPCGASRRC